MQCPTHAYIDVVVAEASGRIDFAGTGVLEQALAAYESARAVDRP